MEFTWVHYYSPKHNNKSRLIGSALFLASSLSLKRFVICDDTCIKWNNFQEVGHTNIKIELKNNDRI